MQRHVIRRAAIGLAVFLLFTIGYPLAVDQAWLRYNAYVLPSIVLIAMLLLSYWFFHSDYALKRFGSIALRGGTWMPPLMFILFGSVVGAFVGLGYYGLLRISKTHIAALLAHENAPKSTQQPQTIERPVTTIPEPPKPPSAFDAKLSEWRFANKPDELTLHDLFLLDFSSVQQKAYGAIFVDDNKTISVQYAINVELRARSKFLSFYVDRQDQHTAAICEYLSGHYEWLLENAPQLLIEQKNPGDSETISTKEVVFSKRIYVYHETYLPAGVTVKLTSSYEKKGLSVVFCSTDYLSTKKMEANLLKLRKEQTKP